MGDHRVKRGEESTFQQRGNKAAEGNYEGRHRPTSRGDYDDLKDETAIIVNGDSGWFRTKKK